MFSLAAALAWIVFQNFSDEAMVHTQTQYNLQCVHEDAKIVQSDRVS